MYVRKKAMLLEIYCQEGVWCTEIDDKRIYCFRFIGIFGRPTGSFYTHVHGAAWLVSFSPVDRCLFSDCFHLSSDIFSYFSHFSVYSWLFC